MVIPSHVHFPLTRNIDVLAGQNTGGGEVSVVCHWIDAQTQEFHAKTDTRSALLRYLSSVGIREYAT